jgi:hypothetical protein
MFFLYLEKDQKHLLSPVGSAFKKMSKIKKSISYTVKETKGFALILSISDL